jgi:hypothetical protein
MRGIKRTLDPDGILTPGKIFQRITASCRRPPSV